MSLPGERIGYIAVSPDMDDEEDAYAAVCGAGRALGYVCASSMYQRVIEKCLDATSDISIYKTNNNSCSLAFSQNSCESSHIALTNK